MENQENPIKFNRLWRAGRKDHWSAGGEARCHGTVAAGARSGAGWGRLSLSHEISVFQRKCPDFASGFALKPGAERFVLRLWCSFLLRWRSLEWNFVLCQEFFRCRRSPRPNGWKMSPGTLIDEWKIIELFRGRNLHGPLNGAVWGAHFHGKSRKSHKIQ